MSTCAIAYDGRETAQRALALVARFASVHAEHGARDSRDHRSSIGTMVIGEAEAMLSLQGVQVRHAPRARHPWRGGGARHRANELRCTVRRRPASARDAAATSRSRTPRRFCCIPISRWSFSRDHAPFVLVHADESCLGNDSTKSSRGRQRGMIEAPAGDSVARWDFYECSSQTTEQQDALAGAIAALEWIRRQWRHALVAFVSDSEYLVQRNERVAQGLEGGGWRRKTGALGERRALAEVSIRSMRRNGGVRWVRDTRHVRERVCERAAIAPPSSRSAPTA